MTQVRVRFCPSPTGNPHVGLIRTALYNWAFARHHGGSLIFRIEDTDAARDSEQSYYDLLDGLRWLGLDWDEGPEVGGPYGPYRQSQRLNIYAEVLTKLKDGGYVYPSYSTPAEIEQRNKAAGRDPKLGYDNADRGLTDQQQADFQAEGRKPVWRFAMPDDTELAWDDAVRGKVSFASSTVPDFVLARSDDSPLYTLTNVVDDALMKITHVIRGEDLLPSTPRQLALYQALTELGIAEWTPDFIHLPLVLGEGNKKLSKRDPQSSLNIYRERGFLPGGFLNYLALLGWAIADDRDVFDLSEMCEHFDISTVSPNPARFDIKKCEAINATHIRRLSLDEFVEASIPYLQQAQLVSDPVSQSQRDSVAAFAPLVIERVTVLSDVIPMVDFALVDEAAFALDEKSAAKALTPDAVPVLEQALAVLDSLPTWSTDEIHEALKTALVEKLGLKPKLAFTPLRVAITGRTISPPLFESMEILGRQTCIARLEAAVVRAGRTA